MLVFSRTKHGADKIARKLKDANHSVAVLHANRSQNQRMEALAGFKSGKYEVMVATDIAARGIDVAGVTHVINYDVPENPEDYVHRIGRTGRAQAVGDAFTLVTPENAGDVRDIQRFIGQKIPETAPGGLPLQGLRGPARVVGPPAGRLPGRPQAPRRRLERRRLEPLRRRWQRQSRLRRRRRPPRPVALGPSGRSYGLRSIFTSSISNTSVASRGMLGSSPARRRRAPGG